MDKLVLGLIADILYIKGVINFEEFEALGDIVDAKDIEVFVEKLIRGEYSGYRKGEAYADYGKVY